MAKLYEQIRELKDRIKENPNSIDLFNQLAKLYNITGQYKKAIDVSNKILKGGVRNKTAFNNLFYAYDTLEEFENVLKVLKNYIASFKLVKKPDFLKFSYSPYAARYFKEKRKIELLVIMNKLPFTLFSEVIENNFNTSFRFSRIGWSERKNEVLNLILEYYPEDIDVINALSYSYLTNEQYTEAKEWLDRALTIDKMNLSTRLLLGHYYRRTSKYKESENEYRYLISASFSMDSSRKLQFDKSGENEMDVIILISALLGLGILYNEIGEHRQAIASLSKVLNFLKQIHSFPSGKNASLSLIYHNLGIAYQGIDSNKMALKAYKKALKNDPTKVVVMTRLGEMYYITKRYKQALEILRNVVKTEPENHLAWHLLSKAHHEKGEMGYAIETNAKSLSLKPNFEPALKEKKILSRHKKII